MTVGLFAFNRCNGLSELTIPASVMEIDPKAIAMNCRNLAYMYFSEEHPTYCSVDGLVYSKDGKTLLYCPNGREDVTLPEGVETISGEAFNHCQKLSRLVIPEGVKTIESNAFQDYYNMESGDHRKWQKALDDNRIWRTL